MSVLLGAPQDVDATPVPHSWFSSSKVHVGLPPVTGEASPQKNMLPVELVSVRKSSVMSLQELELKSADEHIAYVEKDVIVSRRSSSGFPVSQQEDLNFRVTDRQNGSVIYLPQAHARALEPSPSSSPSVPAAMTARPAIARRCSDESPLGNNAAQGQHRTSASGLPLPDLTSIASTRRSIVETQDSFRENMRRKSSKGSKYMSTYSPREGSQVPQDNNKNNSSGGAGTGAGGANGRRHADDHMYTKVQHAIMKTASCCIL